MGAIDIGLAESISLRSKYDPLAVGREGSVVVESRGREEFMFPAAIGVGNEQLGL